MAGLLIGVSVLAGVLIVSFYQRSRKSEVARQEAERLRALAHSEKAEAKRELERIQARFADIRDADEEKHKVLRTLASERARLEYKNEQLRLDSEKWAEGFEAKKSQMEAEHEQSCKTLTSEIEDLEERRATLRHEVDKLDENLICNHLVSMNRATTSLHRLPTSRGSKRSALPRNR